MLTVSEPDKSSEKQAHIMAVHWLETDAQPICIKQIACMDMNKDTQKLETAEVGHVKRLGADT